VFFLSEDQPDVYIRVVTILSLFFCPLATPHSPQSSELVWSTKEK